MLALNWKKLAVFVFALGVSIIALILLREIIEIKEMCSNIACYKQHVFVGMLSVGISFILLMKNLWSFVSKKY